MARHAIAHILLRVRCRCAGGGQSGQALKTSADVLLFRARQLKRRNGRVVAENGSCSPAQNKLPLDQISEGVRIFLQTVTLEPGTMRRTGVIFDATVRLRMSAASKRS